ncbi:MAG TPA: hypothetical protein V6C78_04010 [Crinalium sp.]|jgi:hypothetical protein
MNTVNTTLPLQPLVSGQLLCLSETGQAGLILQHRHYASFAGAGAAVGGCIDIACVSVYAVGNVHFIVPETYQQRQQAYQQRLGYVKTLCRISSVNVPLQRAYLIVRQLCLWLNPKDAIAIPHELISQLVGVLPKSIDLGWQQYLQHHGSKDPRLVSSRHSTGSSGSYYQTLNRGSAQIPVTVLHL